MPTATATKKKPTNQLPRATRRTSAPKQAAPVLVFDDAAVLNAVDRAQAVVEFTLDGIILRANENFLSTLGYTREEVTGKHHSMFVDQAYVRTQEYREFWERLRRGEFFSSEYKRFGKGGQEIWIQATYNPVFDASGMPYKVIKFATDITRQKQLTAGFEGQIHAIYRSQAVIEFALDGTILRANDNFLFAMGYTLDEIKGRHHGMFVDEAYRMSPDYREFWARLNRGEYLSDEFRRFGKGGRELWIQATYNPIFDINGKLCKVVKFASDITPQVLARRERAAKDKLDKEANEELQTKVNHLLQVVAAACDGDLNQVIAVSGNDVAGQMAAGLERLLADFRQSVASIGHTAMGVASSSEELSAISRRLAGSSQDAADQAGSVSSSSEQVSTNVSIVAASAEEMLASIREISRAPRRRLA